VPSSSRFPASTSMTMQFTSNGSWTARSRRFI
jgi:hypothetical protein